MKELYSSFKAFTTADVLHGHVKGSTSVILFSFVLFLPIVLWLRWAPDQTVIYNGPPSCHPNRGADVGLFRQSSSGEHIGADDWLCATVSINVTVGLFSQDGLLYGDLVGLDGGGKVWGWFVSLKCLWEFWVIQANRGFMKWASFTSRGPVYITISNLMLSIYKQVSRKTNMSWYTNHVLGCTQHLGKSGLDLVCRTRTICSLIIS